MKRFGGLKNNPQWSVRRNAIGKIMWLLSLSRNALIVIMGTSMAYIFAIHGEKPFKLTGIINNDNNNKMVEEVGTRFFNEFFYLLENVGKGLPGFNLPNFSIDNNGTRYDFNDMVQELGTSIIFAPLVAILECVAIAKAFCK